MTKLPVEIQSIVNYLRRSRQDEERERRTGEDTLAEQEQLMDRVLSQHGVPYEQHKEIGSGDKIETRPVFKEILQGLKEGRWDAIAVKEISRLGRGSYTDMGVIYDLLIDRRLYIITPSKIYDPKNFSDLRQIRFELFLSREEFEMTRERLMGARYNYALQGKWMAGSVPYGYRYNEQTQRLDIEPEQAQVVRSIFSLYTKQKLGYQAIAKHIEKLEIPTATGRAKWHPEVIHRLLQKSVYIGQVQFRKTERKNGKLIQRPKDEWIVVENAHEPIINREVWLACQKRMGKQNEKLPVNKNHTPWELTSLIICGECGKKMQRQFTTQQYQKKNGENSIYEKEFLRCECGVYVKYREVENRLLEVMERISLDGKQLNEQLATSLLRHETDHALPHVDMLEQIEQEIELLRKKLARSYDLVVEGVFSSKEFEKRRDQYQAKLQIKEQKAAVMRKEHEQSIQDQEQSQNALYDLRTPPSNLMQAYEMIKHRELRNRLLRICFEQILLHVEKKGRGRKPTTFTLRLNTSFFVSLSQTLK